MKPLSRTYTKDGVTYIRPLGYDGKPMLTLQEKEEILALHLPKLEALFAEHRHNRGFK